MILFGIFCGRLKIYICWLAPTCLYLEEAGTQQSAYVSGKPRSFSLKPLSICSHPSIWASLPLLLELKCTTKKDLFSGNAGCPGAGSPWSSMNGLRGLYWPRRTSESATCESVVEFTGQEVAFQRPGNAPGVCAHVSQCVFRLGRRCARWAAFPTGRLLEERVVGPQPPAAIFPFVPTENSYGFQLEKQAELMQGC